ncbi:MAG: cyclase family protein [Candidatus Eremiobacteraeota bacterium]|nr:cyclase family protein [Candidatus Eremiobacteraeota bacterium]
MTYAAVNGVQGRGVLVDIRRHLGDGRQKVNYAQLEEIMRKDSVEVRPGDFLLLHTGFGERLLDMKKNPDDKTLRTMCAVIDGADPALQRWMTDSKIVAIVCDNVAVETQMLGRTETTGAFLPLHELCLFKVGILIGELFYLTELAEWLHASKRSSFLFTGPPLRLPGAVGSPATAIATV